MCLFFTSTSPERKRKRKRGESKKIESERRGNNEAVVDESCGTVIFLFKLEKNKHKGGRTHTGESGIFLFLFLDGNEKN